MISKYFLMICVLSLIFLVVVLEEKKAFNFEKVQFIIFSFCVSCFDVIFKKMFTNLGS